LEPRVLQDVPKIIGNVRGVEVDLQLLQLAAMNRNRKEAGDSRKTGVFGTRASEDKRLQLSQGHSELSDVVVVQLEDAFTPLVLTGAEVIYVEIDQIPKTLNRGDERRIDVDTEHVLDTQNFQRFLRLIQWCYALRGGSTVL